MDGLRRLVDAVIEDDGLREICLYLSGLSKVAMTGQLVGKDLTVSEDGICMPQRLDSPLLHRPRRHAWVPSDPTSGSLVADVDGERWPGLSCGGEELVGTTGKVAKVWRTARPVHALTAADKGCAVVFPEADDSHVIAA